MESYYLTSDHYTLIRNGSNPELISAKLVIDLVLTEYGIRELTQREEKLQHRARALEKAVAIESNQLPPGKATGIESTRAQLEEKNQQLKEVQLQYQRKEVVRIEDDVAAGIVDVANRGIYLKGTEVKTIAQ
ncbi:uncharacterized protein PGRI_082500 [Penicillium griseofulvum]|uniref:Uncharacterized protein n=1 Tax=Penicillium patulum TaxID=5078 RepID=A0A135LSR1_PENPA|nr:uncharacterized protein PGRI_082500 [Penicillium griseofulvum]KXG51966.1 hypothetical protein PGRI_082500 [Penicillium griseofulvum]